MTVQEKSVAMQMLYNSDAFVVVGFELPAAADQPLQQGGFEIVDKVSRKEIFLSGLLAETFEQGARALSERNPSPDQWDDYISGFTTLAQQPVVMH
jgi:hypothetical protein